MLLDRLFAKAAHLAAGSKAEDHVSAYLQAQGLVLLDRNYRCRGGELDLVMRDGAVVVFVEVRYRSGERFGGALASVDFHKQACLVKAAGHYLAAKRIDSPTRFDVALVAPGHGGLAIQWLKDAFRPT